jgi:hypothetical protein
MRSFQERGVRGLNGSTRPFSSSFNGPCDVILLTRKSM